MIKLAIGFAVGALVVAYYPTAGTEVRKLTNTAAAEVESATRDEAEWKQLYNDTVEALVEKTE